jgi:hypothetical protein
MDQLVSTLYKHPEFFRRVGDRRYARTWDMFTAILTDTPEPNLTIFSGRYQRVWDYSGDEIQEFYHMVERAPRQELSREQVASMLQR